MPQSAGRGLAAWPIRRKLTALVAVPIVVIMVAGAWLTTLSVQGLREAQQTRALATTAMATNQATVALDSELSTTLVVLRAPTTATKKAQSDARASTDRAMTALRKNLAEAPGGGWSGNVLMAAHSIELSSDKLTSARRGADAGSRSSQVIESSFQSVFQSLRFLTSTLAQEIATTTADGKTVDQAAMLTALAAASAAAADERASGTIALTDNRLSAAQLATLKKLAVEQDVQLQLANDHAAASQQSDIDAIRSDDSRIQKFRADLDTLVRDDATGATTGTPTPSAKPDPTAFAEAAGQRLRNLDDLVGRVAVTARDSASGAVRSALIGTILLGGLTILTLLLIFATLAAIARTITGPMRRLRSGAVEVATVRLPQAVRQIEQQGIDATIDLPPVMPPGTVAGPETLEVAHAVDGLTAEAVRLATAQVRLRHALDEAFVSMSRRSQTMVEKQLAIIDELESTEEDPEQLRNLFRLDHLAARMRRYNDNLLVLAGSSVRTRSNTPVPVSDVFRAATSEMEQYERVRLQPVNSAAVSGPVAGGLIHLLAELLDNAAMYSPPTSPILLTAAFTPGGGLHLEVTDSGVGIPPAELAELNSRLATPGTIDTQIPSRMGLFVVGRLGQRGGFEVRLSARASAAGTVAEVLVPAAHVVGAPQGGQDTPLPGRIPTPAQRMPGPLSPQGMPTQGMPPGMPPFSGAPIGMQGQGLPPMRPPAGLPPAPVGGPPGAGMPSPSLPRRPNLVWPGSEPKAAERAAGPSTGSLPSRVPGAALSAGPLSGGPSAGGPSAGGPSAGGPGRNGSVAGDASPFDAFGAPSAEFPPIASQAPPPGATPIGPSSAIAAWSPQARAARTGAMPQGTPEGSPDHTGDLTGDRPAFGPLPGSEPGRTGPAAFAPPPDRTGPAPFGSDPLGSERFGSDPLSSERFGSDPLGSDGFGGSRGSRDAQSLDDGPPGRNGTGLPGRTPPFPPPSGSPVLPSFADSPYARPAPRPDAENPANGASGTGWPTTLPPAARDGDADRGPTPPPVLPTRPTHGGDPFATAKLFGVEMPDPATAAGLFTAGPKSGEPAGPEAWSAGQDGDLAERTDRSSTDRTGTDPGRTDAGSGWSGPGSDSGPSSTGELPRLNLKPQANPSTREAGATTSTGAAPAAWEGVLPTEEEARSAATTRYTPADPSAPMIGNLDYVATEAASPIFEAMSAWFSDQTPSTPVANAPAASATRARTGDLSPADADERGALADQGDDRTESLPAISVRPGDGGPRSDRSLPSVPAPSNTGKVGPQDASRLIDLRDEAPATASASVSSRWASLGDQQWLAANARAASAPQVAGDTSAGLPRRQPGANLLPSAASAAPSAPAPSAPFHGADADVVRGRLGSYQRGVSSARQSTSRQSTTSSTAASLFTAARTAETDQGHEPDEQGGEQ